MIFVQPKGRMGNQMFQIATAFALAKEANDGFICSDKVLALSPHTLKQRKRLRETVFRKITFDNTTFKPMSFHTDEEYFSYKRIRYSRGICLSGYYQSFKYFNHLKKEVGILFEPTNEIVDTIMKDFSDLISDNDTCSVHIRRGDYIKYKNHHHNLTKDYYNNAISSMGNDKNYVFFSDDIGWCRDNFSHISDNFIDTGDDIVDFYLMLMMKNSIIANSSYGWWAAFLNYNKDKRVICPSVWFGPANSHLNVNDLFPEDWQKIEDRSTR